MDFGPLTPRHVLITYMEDIANKQCLIRYCEDNGEAFFEHVQGRAHMKTNQRLSVTEVEAAVLKRLTKEQQKAKLALEWIREKGAAVKTVLIEEQVEKFKALADRIVESERQKMKAYLQYQNGELSQTEWASIQAESQNLVRTLEESFFVDYRDRLDRISMLISEENPWITTYQDVHLEKPWKKRDLNRLLSRIVLNNLQIESVELAQQDWFNELSKAWRRIDNGAEE